MCVYVCVGGTDHRQRRGETYDPQHNDTILLCLEDRAKYFRTKGQFIFQYTVRLSPQRENGMLDRGA